MLDVAPQCGFRDGFPRIVIFSISPYVRYLFHRKLWFPLFDILFSIWFIDIRTDSIFPLVSIMIQRCFNFVSILSNVEPSSHIITYYVIGFVFIFYSKLGFNSISPSLELGRKYPKAGIPFRFISSFLLWAWHTPVFVIYIMSNLTVGFSQDRYWHISLIPVFALTQPQTAAA